MSNITTRKGLAFGALVALGSTLLAGAPAHAAAGVTLAPERGTSLNLPAGYGYELRATASSEIPSDRFSEFKFKITNVDGKAGYANVSDGHGLWDIAYNLAGDAGSSVVLNGYAVNNGTVWINSDTTDATSHFVVTAFLDANGNDAVDAGELAGTQTVNFLKASELTATTKVVTPIYTGDDVLEATTQLTNINNEQFRWQNEETAYVAFKGNTSDLGTDTASWDAAGNDFDAALSVSPVSKGLVVSAQAQIYINGVLTNVGAANTATVADSVVNYLERGQVASVNGNNDGDVLVNTEVEVYAQAFNADDKVVPGRTIDVTVDWSNFTLASDGSQSVTIAGKTYKTQAALDAAKISLVTDANGKVSFKVSSTGLVAGNEFRLHYATENRSTGWYLTQVDPTYTAWIENNHWEQFGGVSGSTANGTVVVYNQFGGVLPNGYDARVQFNYEGSRSDTQATDATNSFQPVVNGRASFKVVDNGKGTGYQVYYVEILKRDTVNGGYTSYTSITAPVYFATVYQDAADTVAASVEAWDTNASKDDNGVYQYNTSFAWNGASNNPADVSTGDFGSYDSRAVLGTEPDVSWGNNVYFGGGIVSATTSSHVGTGLAGTPVTISGAGLQFAVNPDEDFTIYATDSITTTTNGGGYFGVSVWSHKSGLNSFTITSGGVTQKVEFYVDAPAWNSGSSITVTAPAFSLPAKAILASAVVTDKFGNVVPDAPASLSVSGLGYPANWYWTDNWTDNDGKLDNSVNVNLNEVGTLTWTATLYSNDAFSASDADKIVKSATTVVALGALVPADAKVAVASAATSQSGRAVDVTVTVTTAAGVAIPGAIVALSSTGAGYLGATTATTDAAGKASVKLVAGASETGDATVTATAGAVSASAKTTFGVTDANINLAGKRVTVDWSFASGKRVVIYRNGIQIRNFVAASDASDSFSFNLKKGTRKISVKVGGVTIDSQTYVIK